MDKINARNLKYGFLNIGYGKDLKIKDLSEIIKKITGFKGKLIWDTDKPNGTPRKMMDVSRINELGWYAKTELEDGILREYNWYKENN